MVNDKNARSGWWWPRRARDLSRRLLDVQVLMADLNTTNWRTRADPEWTAAYGIGELHVVLFEPNDDRPGGRATVIVQIPEASRQQVRRALKHANKLRTRLGFICDTKEQAEAVAETAGAALSSHRRIAYERAEAGGWGLNHA